MDAKEQYATFCQNCPPPLFHQPEWLNRTCGEEGWQPLLYSGPSGEVEAAWPLTYARKWGFRILRNPPLTPWLGPILAHPADSGPEQQQRLAHKAYTHFAEQLPSAPFFSQSCHPGFTNWLPFYWQGCRQTTRYTFRLDLSQDEAQLWQACKPALRRRIRKGQRSLHLAPGGDRAALYPDLLAKLRQAGTALGLSPSAFQSLWQWAEETEQGVLFSARAPGEDRPRGQIGLVRDAHTAYALLITSRDGKPSDSYTIPALLWACIQWSQTQGLSTFDFEGSMIPGVARLFAAFGARPVPYHYLYKYRNRFWELGEWLRKR